MIYGDHIFQLADNGVLSAINKHTGHMFWTRSLGRLSASSPAVTSQHASTRRPARAASGGSPGRIVALNYEQRRDALVARPAEPERVLAAGRPRPLFFGSQNGTVYALNARNGSGHLDLPRRRARSRRARRSRGGVALLRRLLRPRAGDLASGPGGGSGAAAPEGALLGSGTFYSTPAVIYGRVFLGNTDGRVYAYDASTGKLDWAVQTGAYVYSSPAVTNAPGLGPTVYVGSYDGTFYALDARSGHVELDASTPRGRISGSPTIVGRDRVLRRARRPPHATVSASPPAACCSRRTPARSTR